MVGFMPENATCLCRWCVFTSAENFVRSDLVEHSERQDRLRGVENVVEGDKEGLEEGLKKRNEKSAKIETNKQKK
jgi:hypothetical protein